jgi:hypothetical protein
MPYFGSYFGSSGGAIYRMRGFDSTLGRIVYWQTSSVDGTASSYAGPGPVTDIVVQNVIGKPTS